MVASVVCWNGTLRQHRHYVVTREWSLQSVSQVHHHGGHAGRCSAGSAQPRCIAGRSSSAVPASWGASAADRSTHSSRQVDVERHAADFMEAAKTLQLYFIRVQHQHQPIREEALRKEIAGLESDLKAKDALLEKQNKLLQHWQGLLEAQKNIHIQELERV